MNRVGVEPGERIGADGRFKLVRRLGSGGFGTVFEAVDQRYECRVALKVLRRDDPAAIQRFKQEFRSLAEVVHHNLVRLYELATDGDLWFFTMELIEGVSFLDHVLGTQRPSEITADLDEVPKAGARDAVARGVLDEPRLRSAMLQLAEGVEAVHAARKLHCDIKPSNVLVTPSGRVVLLDFGLVTDVDGAAPRGLVGTPGYMAPEQAAQQPATPASDWFSVGVMLDEALAGAAAGAAADLHALGSELRSGDAARRPSGPNVIARLRGTSRQNPIDDRALDRELGFVGRSTELGQLDELWRFVLDERRPALARVVGASGMGKSELVRRFLDRLRSSTPDALVLGNRCYEQDSVPYKAIDGAIDALGEHLAATSPDELGGLSIWGGAFEARELGADSQALRRRAFVALRDILARLGRTRPIVMVLDDLQWGDVDSARLLGELLRPPDPPRLLLIASYRPDATEGFLPVFDEMRLDLTERRIEVGALDPSDALSLASGGVGDSSLAETIVREAAGSPIFIKQLAQQAAAIHTRAPGRSLTFTDVVSERMSGLDEDVRRLVETIAIAGRPIPERVATRAAALDGAAARLATMAARHSHFITTRTVANMVLVETAHDRVRAAISTVIPVAATRAHHARLADTLSREPDPEPEPLVDHLLAAGDEPRARAYALIAVERAERVYAFDRAAQYHALILRLTADDVPDRADLLARWATALANAGRSGEAAEAFQTASDAAASRGDEAARVRMLSRRAAELSLRSGRLEVGAERMHGVLREVGIAMPRTRRRASTTAMVRRLFLFMRGTGFTPRDVAPDVQERLDALWSASSGVSMVNHVLADALGVHHLLEALRAGGRSHLVRGLGYEAAFEAVIGGSFLRKRCERLLAQMDELATGSEDPYDKAWAQMSRGITRWFDGDWETTYRECDAAAATYREHCHGVSWELVVCDAYRLPSLAYIGELGRLAQLVPRAHEAARERGDLFGAATLHLGQHCLITLAADRAAEAIEAAREAVERFPTEIYLLPHYHHLLAFAQAELYRGNAERALERIDDEWRGLERSRLVRVQCLRVEIRHLRARAALATAAVSAERREPLLRVARGEAAKIGRDPIAPAAPLAHAILAGAAELASDRETATRLLAQARDGFAAANMGLYARAAGIRLGALLGGDAGRDEQVQATTWMTAQGVKNPDAMSRMLIPGV